MENKVAGRIVENENIIFTKPAVKQAHPSLSKICDSFLVSFRFSRERWPNKRGWVAYRVMILRGEICQNDGSASEIPRRVCLVFVIDMLDSWWISEVPAFLT